MTIVWTSAESLTVRSPTAAIFVFCINRIRCSIGLADDWDCSAVNERGRPLLSYYHTNGQAYHRGDTKHAFCHYFLGYFVYKISGQVSIDKLQRKRAECQDSVHELLTFSRGPPTACTAGL